MTKYILHGGNSKEFNPDNDSFFREMTAGSHGKTLVLLNYFSREETDVIKLAEQDRQRFLQNSENKDLEFEIAEPEKLTDQLRRVYVMYMRGGETDWLRDRLSQTPQVEQLFKDKVIAGSSAGVYVLSKYYWSNDHSKIGKGLGILDFKAFCHYKPDDTKIVKALLKYKEPLPLFVLPNFKWMVFYR